jgi:hypothetical protein
VAPPGHVDVGDVAGDAGVHGGEGGLDVVGPVLEVAGEEAGALGGQGGGVVAGEGLVVGDRRRRGGGRCGLVVGGEHVAEAGGGRGVVDGDVVPRERGTDAARAGAQLDAGDQPGGVGEGVRRERVATGREHAREDEARGGPQDLRGAQARRGAGRDGVQGERAGVGVDRGDGGAEVQGVGERGAVGHAVHEAGVALGPGERVAVARVLEAAREVVVQSGEGRQLGGGAAVVVAAGVVDGPAQAPAGQAEVVEVAGEGDAVEVAQLGAAAGDGEGEQAAAVGTAALVEGAQVVAPPGPLGGFVGDSSRAGG